MSPASVLFPVVERRRPGRIVVGGILLVVVVLAVWSIAGNERFQWGVVGSYLFSEIILDGLWVTIQLTVFAQLGGIVIGVLLAIVSLAPNPVARSVANAYIWVFRGLPVLVQLLFWFNLAALFPQLSLTLPFIGTVAEVQTNDLVTPWMAAWLGLALCEGAYMSEIVRAGVMSVGRGQVEAARSIGMKPWLTMTRIVLPQAMRVVIPPTGNQVISMLKMTSLVSVISVADLLYSAQIVYSRTFETIPLLVVVSIWYLLLTSVLTLGQRYLERHFSRSVA